jgi:hydroxyethylthiazole kinase-like uncharacterized protein yjeF
MKILTAAQMREVDRLSIERAGVSSLALMENAGASVAEFLIGQFRNLARRKILVLCGKGNNGGDGFVVAQKLREIGANPFVILCDAFEAVQGDAAVNLHRWQETRGILRSVHDASEWEAFKNVLDGSDLVIDALLGTGLHGPVEGLLAQVIADVNAARPAAVVAVDIPSGLSADSAELSGPSIWADFTVTFTAPKIGMIASPASERVGKLLVRQIGSPRSLVEEVGKEGLRWLEPGEFSSLPLKRKLSSHKGDYGHALIVAGSCGKTGAAVLAGWAALRVGAGLVTVATPETELSTVAVPVPELMTEPLRATSAGTVSYRSYDPARFTELLVGKNVMAIGPGLSTHPESQDFIREATAMCHLPLILDADGLNAFAGRERELTRRHAPSFTITPHPGEMARLLDCSTAAVQARRLETAKRASAEWDTYVVLKGSGTIIASPLRRMWINSTGNPGMATAGTGDVLTGMLAGLAAQFGPQGWETALGFGVYLHGLAGDLAVAETGEASLMASDLIRAIPQAYARVLAEMELV